MKKRDRLGVFMCGVRGFIMGTDIPSPGNLHRFCWMSLMEERTRMRSELDALSDFVTDGKTVDFRREFRTIKSSETYCMVPNQLLERAKMLLTDTLVDSVAKSVHDKIVFPLGCSSVPLFALVRGGRDRTLFKFRCVFDLCSGFLEVRLFSGVYSIKWMMIGLSHSHDFTSFPRRTPHGTFTDATLQQFREMVQRNQPCSEMIMKNDVFCSKHVFQNSLRQFRSDKRKISLVKSGTLYAYRRCGTPRSD